METNKLTPEDHRRLVHAYHDKELARLEFEVKSFDWNQECDRIVLAYQVNSETHHIDIPTGTITERPKEQS